MLENDCIKTDSFRETAEFLYKDNFRYIYKVVNILVEDKAITDDIVQEAFLKAFQNINQLRDINKFRSWLASIAVNLCKDYFSKTSREISVEKLFAPSGSPTPEEQVLATVPDANFEKALKQLEYNEKEVLMLKYQDGYSTQEIADYYNINVQSVNARLFRARKKFKRIHETNQEGGIDIVQSS